MPAPCPCRLAACAPSSSGPRPSLAPARPASRSPFASPSARSSTTLSPPRAQVGEPSKREPSTVKGTPGAPPPKKESAEEGDASATDAAAAAMSASRASADTTATSSSEGAARADAIAAERKADEGEALSEDDIRRLAALRRSGVTSSGTADSGGLIQGVLEEARLIEWPTFGRAVGDTAVVLAIVAVSAAVMFAINTGLTEFSAWIYG